MTWTLTTPEGKTYEGSTRLEVLRKELDDRVPPEEQLKRINEIKVTPLRIALYVEGGLVQGVFTDDEYQPIEVVIYDYDCEGADNDEVVHFRGRDAVGHSEFVIVNEELVNQVFKAFT